MYIVEPYGIRDADVGATPLCAAFHLIGAASEALTRAHNAHLQEKCLGSIRAEIRGLRRFRVMDNFLYTRAYCYNPLPDRGPHLSDKSIEVSDKACTRY